MSIVTLKRKTQTQYRNMSVGVPNGFSLNGTHRSQGFVGQSSLSRNLVRTLAKGSTLKGHGGCCGKYPVSNIVTSPDMSTLEDISVVKSSVLNTQGLIMTKYRWIRRPDPLIVKTKPYGNHIGEQGYYIDNIAKKSINCDDKNKPTAVEKCTSCNPAGINMTTGKSYHSLFYKNSKIFKPESSTGSISQSNYLRKLNEKCAGFDNFYFTRPSKSTPFSCGVV